MKDAAPVNNPARLHTLALPGKSLACKKELRRVSKDGVQFTVINHF